LVSTEKIPEFRNMEFPHEQEFENQAIVAKEAEA
jgi:hypothetical protein